MPKLVQIDAASRPKRRVAKTSKLAVVDAAAKPSGDLTISVLAMPADTNQSGDIFGGWVLGQMDIAGEVFVAKLAKGRSVTVAVDAMTFRKPVFVGDVVCIYAKLIRFGTTSTTVAIEAWVMRRGESDLIRVTAGTFTYVSIGRDRQPIPVVRKMKPSSRGTARAPR